MKPTKEQLADPKWWDAYAKDGENYCYFDHEICKYFFSNNEYMVIEIGNILELLAKRPEPEWVPEVGDSFEFSVNGVSWEQREMLYIDDHSMLMAHKKYPANRWHHKADDPDLMFKPIKTQREELIEILVSTRNLSEGLQADAILARFELTEKDGE